MSLWWIFGFIVILLFVLSKLSPSLKYHIKYFGLCLSYIELALVCSVFALFNPRSSKNIFIAQFFLWLLRIEWMFGIDVQIEDWEHLKNAEKPVVIVSNHQTVLDALILLKTSPNGTAQLAKKSLMYVPIFGPVCWLYGTIYIDRSNFKSAIEVMKNAASEMKQKGSSIWIFPEGTRYQNDNVMSFKKGAFHLAIQAQVPIVPVVIGNYRNVIDRKNRLFDGGVIRVKPLDPISTTGLKSEDVNDLLEKVHQRISDGYEEDYKSHANVYENLIPLKEE